jgi:ribonucleotide reductase alpha subunit
MKRVEANAQWSLMCPHECPGGSNASWDALVCLVFKFVFLVHLSFVLWGFDRLTHAGLYQCHSEEFEALYTRYEKEGRARRQVPAQQLWFAIIESQIESGTPYMLVQPQL